MFKTYEFECPECDQAYEIMEDWSETISVLCNECNIELERVYLSAPKGYVKGTKNPTKN